MPHRDYFREHVRKVSAAGSPEILAFTPREERLVYHVTRISVENETSIGTGDIRLAVTGHGQPHYLRQFNAPAPDVLYTDDQEVLLLDGETLEARFSGTTASDVLHLYAEGWWEVRLVGEVG